jgi:hypothetical protein
VITHIDNDHTNGIVKLLDSELSKSITIENIFFNGLEQFINEKKLDENEFDLEFESISSYFEEESVEDTEIGYSEGTSLSYILNNNNLISNSLNNGKPIHQDSFDGPQVISNFSIKIIGPSKEAIDELSNSWFELLEERQISSKIISPKHIEAFEKYVNSLTREELLEEPISSEFDLSLNQLANSKYVADNSLPNKTSISFILESNNKKILFLGDSHVETVIDWLNLNEISVLEVDAIKIAHHGSKHNINKEFMERIISRKYLISTDGSRFKHPDLEALARIAIFSKLDEIDIYINNSISHITDAFLEEISNLPKKVNIKMGHKEVIL